ncbi:MAG: phosphoadenosine phosphosulfate reductase family protein, partial [Verrucomicrobiota bacterium]
MASAAKQTKSKAKPEPRAKADKVAAPAGRTIDLRAAAPKLKDSSAEDRVAWAIANFGEKQTALSSSFGAQSAVLLHMVTTQAPKIPVILVDTGYLFPETYKFVDDLTERLDLNLKVYQSKLSPAWQEARFGKLWEQGVEGIEKYNELN